MSAEGRVKAAYLPLYVRDWRSDARVALLDWERRALYLDLLLLSWELGPLPDNPTALARTIGYPGGPGPVEELLRDFFDKGDAGWTNPRLEYEREKVRELMDQRRAAGSKGASARWQTHSKGNAVANGGGNGGANGKRNAIANGKTMARAPEPEPSSDCSGLPDPHGLPECSIPTSLRSVAGGSGTPPPEPPPRVEGPPPVVEIVPAKAKRAPRKPAQGPHPDAIRFWEQTWGETHESPWVWTGKEAKAVATCLALAKGDLDDYRARVSRILREPPDRWTAQNASPSLLAERWNQILVRTVGRAEERQLADLRDGMRAVDELDQSGFFDQFDENGRLRA